MTQISSSQGGQKLVAIAIDKDKGSLAALKWALETKCQKGQRILLIHVRLRPPGTSLAPPPSLNKISQQHKAFDQLDAQTRELLSPFRVFCSRKDVHTQEIVLEDQDVSRALISFVKMSGIDVLVLGAASKSSLFRFRAKDTPGHVLKGVPDFCSVFIIAKGKISTSRPSARLAPPINSFRSQMLHQSGGRSSTTSFTSATSRGSPRSIYEGAPPRYGVNSTPIRSPFSNRKGTNGKLHEYSPAQESDISFVSCGRASVENIFPSFSDNNDSFMSQRVDDEFSEMERLKQELKERMEMYNSACKEAITAKQKALELQNWKMEEQRKREEARSSVAAIGHSEAAQKRVDSEIKAVREVDESDKVVNELPTTGLGYRRYAIEEIEDATDRFSQSRKIGEGVYGPVYKCRLDHTPVAVKVLRPDAAQGRSQFHHEVEVLSRIRHPNMVLLLGACPEYGCLVYEHMSQGSLEDHLMQRGKTAPLSWLHRFQIAAEITSSLLFLHNTKPEPIVHRSLKPKSVLLDRNFVSKLSHVGLSRLVPPSVADTVTQSSAGTSGYVDPEYQQTGILSVQSDVYSLGILLLQMLTSRPPMGLAHHIRRAIESGALAQILDPAVPDWPVEEALCLAKLALQCCELRRKDRPDLGKVVMPELERLRELSDRTYSSSSMHSDDLSLNHS